MFYHRPSDPDRDDPARFAGPLRRRFDPRRLLSYPQALPLALPAPAANLLDQIGMKLETLGPQLQTLDPREPAAQEVRKILTEHLPDLVNGYKRVPEPLRRERQSNGRTPDQQLAEGLKLIDEEIAEMTRNIAAGDLDSLATQGKFLELKYRDPEGMGD